jgi:hypothetical protein
LLISAIYGVFALLVREISTIMNAAPANLSVCRILRTP